MKNYNNYMPYQNGFQQMQDFPLQQNVIQPHQYQQIPQQSMTLSPMPVCQSCSSATPFNSATSSGMTVPAQFSSTQVPTTAVIPSAPSSTSSNLGSIMDIAYTQGYLKTQIGRRVKIEFLLGTNMLVDREGTLLSVGASYLTIREVETDDILLCDLYSIKFVRFYY